MKFIHETKIKYEDKISFKDDTKCIISHYHMSDMPPYKACNLCIDSLGNNKFCTSGQSTFMGSNEWYHNLASPNNVRLNLWTFTPSTKQCVFIQSFE